MSDTESPLPKHHFQIFEYIKDIQSRNGIREDQHIRYRQYCSRRLRRVRVVNKIPIRGGARYKNTPLTASQYTTPQHLTIPLLNAERAWAYAMELQSSLETIEEAKDLRRARHQIKRRLLRAIQHAEELESISNLVGDDFTHLQATAYLFWLRGVYALEIEDWENALGSFSNAKEILSQMHVIAEKQHNTQLSQICSERITQLQLYITFCSNRLNRLNPGAAAAAVASSQDSVLMAKLSAIAADSSLMLDGDEHQKKQQREVTLFNTIYHVHNPKTFAKLHEAKLFYDSYCLRLKQQQQKQGEQQQQETMGDNDDSTASATATSTSGDMANVVDDNERFFAHLQSFYDHALIFIKQDRKAIELGQNRVKTQSDSELLEQLIGLEQYAQCHKMEITIHKHILSLDQALIKHHANVTASSSSAAGNAAPPSSGSGSGSGNNHGNTGLSSSIQEQLTSLRVIITMIDRLLYALQQAMTTFRDTMILPVIEQKQTIIETLRVYYLSLFYLLQDKPLESYALACRAKQQFSSTLSIDFITNPITTSNNNDNDPTIPLEFSLFTITPMETQWLSNRQDNVNRLIPYSQALCVGQQLHDETQLSQSIDRISLDKSNTLNHDHKDGYTSSLLSQLLYNDDHQMIIPSIQSFQQPLPHGSIQHLRSLVPLPPRPTLLPAKPFVFDMAYTHIVYDDDVIASTLPKQQQQQQPQQQQPSQSQQQQAGKKQPQQQQQQQQTVQQQQQQQEEEETTQEPAKSFWNYLFW